MSANYGIVWKILNVLLFDDGFFVLGRGYFAELLKAVGKVLRIFKTEHIGDLRHGKSIVTYQAARFPDLQRIIVAYDSARIILSKDFFYNSIF